MNRERLASSSQKLSHFAELDCWIMGEETCRVSYLDRCNAWMTFCVKEYRVMLDNKLPILKKRMKNVL